MQTFTAVLGGLGLFLLGMILMTDALHSLTGETMRNLLMRFTRNPLSGVITGTLSTTLLQSSSATTVAVVGFVSAGLMTFNASLGVIFGASIGTTATGWLVALIGFKLQFTSMMLPVIFAGVILRFMGTPRVANIGMTLAGFGLIFVGIDTLQQGMSSLEGQISPDILPTDSITGYMQLIIIGVLMAAVTQSSSAGMAAALTAVYTHTINFEQAAIMVIGMSIGTTITALVASIGTSVNARRTAFSHVLYNFLAAIIAMFLLPVFIQASEMLAAGSLLNNTEILLVSFHSLFNIIAAICILPFIKSFAAVVKKIIPNKEDAYTETLDDTLLDKPDLALTAATASVRNETRALLQHLLIMLNTRNNRTEINLSSLQSSMSETYDYVEHIHINKDEHPDWDVLISIIHSLDHMQRLHQRCEENINKTAAAMQTPEFFHYIDATRQSLLKMLDAINSNDWATANDQSRQLADMLSEESKNLRQTIVDSIASGSTKILKGTDGLKATRWLRRVSAHLVRITHYQAKIHDLLKK